jgi:hypothetical protein
MTKNISLKTDPSLQVHINEFIAELKSFAGTAEDTLKEIEKNLEKNKGLLIVFYERMFAIRGTAQQLKLDAIGEIAALGEAISLQGSRAQSRRLIRKCVGSLWDALSTVQYLLEHWDQETSEEQDILKHRLRSTLKSLGGAQTSVNSEEISNLFKSIQN